MPRCGCTPRHGTQWYSCDSIVNGRNLANEKQTKRDSRKFVLAKTFQTLDRQTGKSTEEYAVAKALLNLSVGPAMSSGEQIK